MRECGSVLRSEGEVRDEPGSGQNADGAARELRGRVAGMDERKFEHEAGPVCKGHFDARHLVGKGRKASLREIGGQSHDNGRVRSGAAQSFSGFCQVQGVPVVKRVVLGCNPYGRGQFFCVFCGFCGFFARALHDLRV